MIITGRAYWAYGTISGVTTARGLAKVVAQSTGVLRIHEAHATNANLTTDARWTVGFRRCANDGTWATQGALARISPGDAAASCLVYYGETAGSTTFTASSDISVQAGGILAGWHYPDAGQRYFELQPSTAAAIYLYADISAMNIVISMLVEEIG